MGSAKGTDFSTTTILVHDECPPYVVYSTPEYPQKIVSSELFTEDNIYIRIMSKNCHSDDELEIEKEKIEKLLALFPNSRSAVSKFVKVKVT